MKAKITSTSSFSSKITSDITPLSGSVNPLSNIDVLATDAELEAHTSRIDNPHGVTPAQLEVYTSLEVDNLVSTTVENLLNSAPTNLDTLKELADALGNDENFSETVLTLLSGKASLTEGNTFSGLNSFTNEIKVNQLSSLNSGSLKFVSQQDLYIIELGASSGFIAGRDNGLRLEILDDSNDNYIRFGYGLETFTNILSMDDTGIYLGDDTEDIETKFTNIQSHINATNNPHGVTALDIKAVTTENTQQTILGQKTFSGGIKSLNVTAIGTNPLIVSDVFGGYKLKLETSGILLGIEGGTRAEFTADDISFLNSSGTIAKFNSDGNVGIGTETPRTKLDVTGNIYTDWQDRFIGTSFQTGVSYQMGMKFGSDERDLRIWNKSADGNSVSGITFWTGSTPSERMRIDYDGNVGIGTIDPSKLLTISGSGFNPRVLIDTTDTESYPGFEFRHNGDNARRTLIRSDYESGSPNLTFYTCEDGTITEKMRIEGNGNIGIGTDTPSNILHISKSVNSGYTEALIENTGTTGAAGFEFKTNTHRWKTGVNINDDYRIRDESNSNNVFTIEDGAGDNALYIKNGGNVGIGTSDPSQKLDVNGNIQLQDNGNILWNGYQKVSNPFDMAIGINVDRDNITGLDFKNNSTTGQVRFMARADDDSYVVMNSPSSQMTGAWFGRNRNSSHYVWSTGGRTLAVGTLANNDLVFGTNDTERMMIDGTTGNVGIGTSSPNDLLVVKKNTSTDFTKIRVENDSTGTSCGAAFELESDINNGFLTAIAHSSGRTITRSGITLGGWTELLATTGTNGLLINTQSDKPVVIGSNNIEVARFTSNGNVGIGTTTPSEKLDVTGNANITGDLSVTGHFSAATKSFLIDNPETGGKLQYGVLEGNEHAVYYRGKTSESIIELPKEWAWLVDPDNVTTTVTPIGKFQPLYVISQDSDQVEIGGVEGEYNYVIYGTRKDVEPLEVDI
jgi:uncharacterized protein YaiE (UPF0345 family)